MSVTPRASHTPSSLPQDRAGGERGEGGHELGSANKRGASGKALNGSESASSSPK